MTTTPLIPGTLPQRKGEIWQGGWFEVPFWVRRAEGEVSKPWLAMWACSPERFAKPGDLNHARGSDEHVLVLLDEMFTELQRRPERIEVSEKGLAALLRERLDTSGIEITRRDELGAIEEVVSGMASELGVPDFTGALEVRGVSVDAMREYAKAARAFYDAAPWRHLTGRDLIEIRSNAPPGFRFAILQGMGSSRKGLVFFDDTTAFWQAVSDEPGVVGGQWTLTYGSIAELPASDASLWMDHGLEVAGPSAYPLTVSFQSANRVKRPSPRVLEFLTGLLSALAASEPEQLDQGRWTRAVQKPAGPERTYGFVLPLLLEPPTAEELARREILPDRRALERISYVLHKKFGGNAASTPAELNEMLRKELDVSGGEVAYEPKDDRERAQEICFAAFDDWGRHKIQRIERALSLDPECVDALVLKAEHAPELEDKVELYTKAVAAGAKLLEEYGLEARRGDIWKFQPARAYVRALHGLGHALQGRGREEEAIACFVRILELDESDHEAVRYCVLNSLLLAGRFRDAEEIIKSYRTSDESVWQYAKALAGFGRYGDGKRSRKALGEAFKENPIAALALLDLELPDDREVDEAVDDAVRCARELEDPWDDTSGAFDWLAEQFDVFMESRPRRTSGPG